MKFSQEELEKYLKFMYQLSKDKKNNESEGFKKIATKCGFAQNKAIAIRKYLKDIGIIEVKGNRTYIVKKLRKVI